MSPTLTLLARIDAAVGPLSLADIWTARAYGEARGRVVRELIDLKRARRVMVGSDCSMVFESRCSVWFQIHEELHVHPGARETLAARLLEDYRELVPRPGELRASLFLECSDPRRARRLGTHLAEHIERLQLQLPQGRYDARPLEPLSAGLGGVTFLRFVPAGSAPPLGPEAGRLCWSAPWYDIIRPLDREIARELAKQLDASLSVVPSIPAVCRNPA